MFFYRNSCNSLKWKLRNSSQFHDEIIYKIREVFYMSYSFRCSHGFVIRILWFPGILMSKSILQPCASSFVCFSIYCTTCILMSVAVSNLLHCIDLPVVVLRAKSYYKSVLSLVNIIIHLSNIWSWILYIIIIIDFISYTYSLYK